MHEARLGRIERVQAWALRAPIDEPVRTSFGVMRDRSAVWLALTGADGAIGWGEVWCNFPPVGAEHRARLVIDTLAPLVVGTDWADAPALQESLRARLHILALQSAEFGPIEQTISGIDAAAWDLVARRAGEPLWRLLGGQDARLAVYASGINPREPLRTVERMRGQGHTAFKLKVGFGVETDRRNLQDLREALGDGASLMIDANQAWQAPHALGHAQALADLRPLWLEEPIAADRPWHEWQQLAHACGIPLAAGENLRGDDAFGAALHSAALRHLQPDVGKWGGVTGCLRVARMAHAVGVSYCPHWLGGAIGLAASLHLKAAAGGAGWAEIDANPNPLREQAGAMPPVRDGHVTLTDAPGIGVEPALDLIERHCTWAGTSADRHRPPVRG